MSDHIPYPPIEQLEGSYPELCETHCDSSTVEVLGGIACEQCPGATLVQNSRGSVLISCPQTGDTNPL